MLFIILLLLLFPFFYFPFTAFARPPQCYPETLYPHPCLSSLWPHTHVRMCHHTNGILAPGIRSPVLFPSPLAPFCFFPCQQQCSLFPRPVFLVHRSSPRLAPFRHCFARTADGHASVCVSAPTLPYAFFVSLFFFFFYLFYFTRTYFLRRAYRASQRITFMGFPEIKRIPCRDPGAGKFRRRACDANHLES